MLIFSLDRADFWGSREPGGEPAELDPGQSEPPDVYRTNREVRSIQKPTGENNVHMFKRLCRETAWIISTKCWYFCILLTTCMSVSRFIACSLVQNYLLGRKETCEMAERNKEALLEVSLFLSHGSLLASTHQYHVSASLCQSTFLWQLCPNNDLGANVRASSKQIIYHLDRSKYFFYHAITC